MELTSVLSHYPIAKKVFYNLSYKDLINCYHVSNTFQYFARKQLNALCEEEWRYVSMTKGLTESFIYEFRDKVDWKFISIHQILSHEFIRRFSDKVHWLCISKHQTLTEDFIREFKDKVDWFFISFVQTLSEKFIIELLR